MDNDQDINNKLIQDSRPSNNNIRQNSSLNDGNDSIGVDV